jgi:hypothetical protein
VTESVAYGGVSEERTLVVDWIGLLYFCDCIRLVLVSDYLRLQQCCVCIIDLVLHFEKNLIL